MERKIKQILSDMWIKKKQKNESNNTSFKVSYSKHNLEELIFNFFVNDENDLII